MKHLLLACFLTAPLIAAVDSTITMTSTRPFERNPAAVVKLMRPSEGTLVSVPTLPLRYTDDSLVNNATMAIVLLTLVILITKVTQ